MDVGLAVCDDNRDAVGWLSDSLDVFGFDWMVW